jgi:hypothetical protein
MVTDSVEWLFGFAALRSWSFGDKGVPKPELGHEAEL